MNATSAISLVGLDGGVVHARLVVHDFLRALAGEIDGHGGERHDDQWTYAAFTRRIYHRLVAMLVCGHMPSGEEIGWEEALDEAAARFAGVAVDVVRHVP